MNKITILLISVFITCGCEKKIDFTYRPSEKQKLANKIRKESAIQLKNELGLIPCGSGGQMMGQIKMLALAFDYHKPLDIETGRELLIASVEKFTAEINSNEAIRPYLGNYPFGPKNIEIEIYIQDQNGEDFGPKKLSIITARKGLLRYKIHTPDNCALETVHEETFEEAIKRVNSR